MPRGDLANISRDVLAPLWGRHDIPTERIARTLGVTRQAVSWHAKRLGLPSRKHVRARKLDDATFRRMWLAGVSTAEMAQVFGYSSRSALSHRADILGLPRRTRGTGTKNHGGWRETISLTQFYEQQLGEAMRRAA